MQTRRGFTLIEVLIAVVLLAILALGVARFAATFGRSVANSSFRVVAAGIANDQLQQIRADPRYTSLVALYNGKTTTGFQDYPSMKQSTYVVRDQSGVPPRDRTTVTVRVTAPNMPDTVSVTSVIASP